VIGAIDWDALVPAGAFIVGIVAGTIATIRVMRHVLGYVRADSERHRRD
jgi:hypothetical protein